jgi:hypothetical protein
LGFITAAAAGSTRVEMKIFVFAFLQIYFRIFAKIACKYEQMLIIP